MMRDVRCDFLRGKSAPPPCPNKFHIAKLNGVLHSVCVNRLWASFACPAPILCQPTPLRYGAVLTDDSGPTGRGRGWRIGVQHQSHRPCSTRRNHPRVPTIHYRIYQPHHRHICPPSPGAHEQRALMVNTPCFLQSNQVGVLAHNLLIPGKLLSGLALLVSR